MINSTELTATASSGSALGGDWLDEHADYLLNFAIGQVRDTSTAEDLVQETFFAAVKARFIREVCT